MGKNRAEIGHVQGNASYKISRSVLIMILQMFNMVRRLALQAWTGAADLLRRPPECFSEGVCCSFRH